MAAVYPKNKFLVPALLALLAPSLGLAAVLGEVKVESEGGKSVLKVVSTGKVSPVLSSEPGKVIIDIKGGQRGKGDEIKVGKLGVRQIRFGQKPGSYRIVVDMEKGLGVGAKVTESGESGFSVVLGAAPAAKPAAAKEAAAAEPVREETALELAPVAAGLTYRVVDVSYAPAGDKIQVIISTDGPINYKTAVKEGGRLIQLTLRNASLAWTAPGEDRGRAPVKSITAKQGSRGGESQVWIDIALSEKAPYSLGREQNQLVVSFDRPIIGDSERRGPGNIDMPVTLEVEQADLVGVIKTLAGQAGFEVDFSKEMVTLSPDQRLVTFSAVKRPLRDVLGSLLAPVTMAYDIQGSLMYVGKAMDIKAKKQTLKKLLKEYTPRYMTAAQLTALMKMSLAGDETIDVAEAVKEDPRDKARLIFGNNEGDVAKLMALARKLDAPEEGEQAAAESKGGSGKGTKVFRLNYLDTLGEALLKDGIDQVVPAEERTSGTFVYRFDPVRRILVATGKVKYLDQVGKLLERIDVKQAQVHIEGKIVEVSQTDAKTLGIDLSFDSNYSLANPPVSGANRITARSNQGAGLLSIVNSQNLARITANIDALVTADAADVISSPSITIMDNALARINITDSIPFQTQERSSGTGETNTSIKFENQQIPLTLEVLPLISLEDMTVAMKINFILTSISGVKQEGAPAPTTQQGTITNVTVPSGETAVIGGLMRDSLTKATSKVPVLGDIPLLGLLFRRDSVTKIKKEIIIFITPKIEEL